MYLICMIVCDVENYEDMCFVLLFENNCGFRCVLHSIGMNNLID